MSYTRRAFVKAAGLGGAGVLAARRQAWAALTGTVPPPRPLLLHNNENPLGPGPAVLDAVRAALGAGGRAGRYCFDEVAVLQRAIADRFAVTPENVVIGCGSTQILRNAVPGLHVARAPPGCGPDDLRGVPVLCGDDRHARARDPADPRIAARPRGDGGLGEGRGGWSS
jgi:hypothetical protein